MQRCGATLNGAMQRGYIWHPDVACGNARRHGVHARIPRVAPNTCTCLIRRVLHLVCGDTHTLTERAKAREVERNGGDVVPHRGPDMHALTERKRGLLHVGALEHTA